MHVHIYRPAATDVRIERHPCPSCGERPAPFVITRYEWHGPRGTCLRCGDEWSDGHRLDRPFARGWREANKRRARQHYRTALAAARGLRPS